MGIVGKKPTSQEKLLQIIEEKGLTPEKTKKTLEDLKTFWNDKIGLDYKQVQRTYGDSAFFMRS